MSLVFVHFSNIPRTWNSITGIAIIIARLSLEDCNEINEEPSVEEMKAELTNCIYLQDSTTQIYGLKIYGTPWQPEFCGWAFNLPRGQVNQWIEYLFLIQEVNDFQKVCFVLTFLSKNMNRNSTWQQGWRKQIKLGVQLFLSSGGLLQIFW